MKRFIQLTIITLTVLSLSFNIALAQDRNERTANEAVFLEESGLGANVSISQIVSSIIRTLLALIGVLFVVLIIYAGFMWMTAAGNDEQIAKAKKIITGATVGLAIVLSAYAITYFIIDQILEATKGGTGLD